MAYTLSNIKTRYAYLIGESATTSLDAVDTSHINAAIQDIVNAFPFPWAVKTASLTLVAGSANLPTDYNPTWGILDARIEASSDQDDSVFERVPIDQRDNYTANDYVYWSYYDTTNRVHLFKSKTQTGTVTIYYYSNPTDLSADGDYTIVPDQEAIAYLAASKNWIGDERNTQLKQEYEQEAEARIKAMYQNSLMFGPTQTMGNPVDYNPELYQGKEDTGLRISEP